GIKPGGAIPDEQVFNGFGCSGKNVSPALKWSGAPKDTKGFAPLVHDPDAPTGGAGWWHWVLINIPAATTELPKGAGKNDGSAVPSGAISIATDFGTPGYGGPFRLQATSRIAITLRCTRSKWTSSTFRRMREHRSPGSW